MKHTISTELLKLRRKELGLTQSEIAIRLSIGRSQYANIELGNCNPSIPVLMEILKILDIKFEELYGLEASERLLDAKKRKIEELKAKIAELENQTTSK
jgi:transcriptional regulator with XRE-family HTH domain